MLRQSAPLILLQNLAPGTEFLRPETKRLNRPFFLRRDRLAHNQTSYDAANAAFSREVSENAKFRECVVVCAVRYEPVSGGKFPANREINREFRDSGPSEANFVARNHCAAAAFYEIPYAN
jgi:hypothetical protein